MKKINIVLEGKLKNSELYCREDVITHQKAIIPMRGGWSFRKPYVTSYTLIDESNKDQYSFWKGALGVALFGGIGAIAGLKGKKSKEYLVAIQWKDGEKSLICIDDECYKTLVKCMF